MNAILSTRFLQPFKKENLNSSMKFELYRAQTKIFVITPNTLHNKQYYTSARERRAVSCLIPTLQPEPRKPNFGGKMS